MTDSAKENARIARMRVGALALIYLFCLSLTVFPSDATTTFGENMLYIAKFIAVVVPVGGAMGLLLFGAVWVSARWSDDGE